MSGPERVIHLVVKDGPDKGKMFFLKSGKEATLGRGPTCDLRLTDPGTSSKHCIVRSAGDLVFVQDLNSRNGTVVNGERTTDRVLDENGTIEIGTSKIELKWVQTESNVPLSSVQSVGAPTLMENPSTTTQRINTRETHRIPSTVLSDTQLKDFRAARELLGRSIAGYLLLETLGVNDLGVVFRSKTLKTKDPVALTVTDKGSFKTAELLKTFLDDTKTHLEFPSSIPIVAKGTDADTVYVATALVKGRDFDSLMDAGRKYTPQQVGNFFASICETLAAAHAKGIFHRELRPQSILIDENEQPHLQFLGLGYGYDFEFKSIFTRKEDLKRISYLAPELTLSKSATPQSDVFSLGTTMFHILTGQRAFEAKTKLELIRKIRWEDTPPLATLNKDIPQPLADAVTKAMAKEPAARFQDMKSFADALRALN
ncbi:MAG TPA: FHA domain-containing serine/threonine-protein kinase [Planctomycetota bacterium]|nr:FHA domain-containing serine/threonine-protein kinase [Planctomycetota bacterium]